MEYRVPNSTCLAKKVFWTINRSPKNKGLINLTSFSLCDPISCFSKMKIVSNLSFSRVAKFVSVFFLFIAPFHKKRLKFKYSLTILVLFKILMSSSSELVKLTRRSPLKCTTPCCEIQNIIGSDISIKSLKGKTLHQRRLQFNQRVKRAF